MKVWELFEYRHAPQGQPIDKNDVENWVDDAKKLNISFKDKIGDYYELF